MSIEAVGWALHRNLETAEKFVLVALANFADVYGVCWPHQETLQTLTGLGWLPPMLLGWGGSR